MIKVPTSKTNVRGSFVVCSSDDQHAELNYYSYLDRYHKIRMELPNEEPYLLQVRNNKCTRQRVGINTVGGVPCAIATCLQLVNPKQYTGHTFRRSSATALVEGGADNLTLKRHGRWRSDAVAERYIVESVHHQTSVAKRICYNGAQTSSSSTVCPETERSTASISESSTSAKSPCELLSFGENNHFFGNFTINFK